MPTTKRKYLHWPPSDHFANRLRCNSLELAETATNLEYTQVQGKAVNFPRPWNNIVVKWTRVVGVRLRGNELVREHLK